MNAWRIFFRVEKLGRIPHVGNIGFTYVTPIAQRDLSLLKDAAESTPKGVSNARSPGNLTPGFRQAPFRRYFSTVTTTDIQKSDDARGAPKKKPKTAESVKILLISETHSKTAVTLEEATKIAARKGLHLIPVENKILEKAQTEKHVYKLVTNAEFLALEEGPSDAGTSTRTSESFQKDEKKKDKEVKSMVLKSSIAEHDLLSKLKNIRKMIDKGHTVRMMIGRPGDKGNAESVYKSIESSLKDTGIRFIQKVVKGEQIRFQLMSPKDQPTPKSKSDQKAAHPETEIPPA